MPQPWFAVSGKEKGQITKETVGQGGLSLPAEGAIAFTWKAVIVYPTLSESLKPAFALLFKLQTEME